MLSIAWHVLLPIRWLPNLGKSCAINCVTHFTAHSKIAKSGQVQYYHRFGMFFSNWAKIVDSGITQSCVILCVAYATMMEYWGEDCYVWVGWCLFHLVYINVVCWTRLTAVYLSVNVCSIVEVCQICVRCVSLYGCVTSCTIMDVWANFAYLYERLHRGC